MFTSDLQILKLIDILKDLEVIRFDTNFCDEINISKQHLQNIKSQLKNPERKQNYHFTAEQIELICKIYGVDANWIIGVTDKPFPKKRVTQKVTSVTQKA
ncbi:MAG: hypothetical protein LC112_11000 [Flavobacteriales bacterium]|nr:hypothetical protein [Flavobacteriales bacterium]